jgi:prolyl oligopeptidase
MTLKSALHHLIASGLLALIASSAGAQSPTMSPTMNDPYLWLEDVQSEQSLNWARERNAVTQGFLEKRPVFEENQKRLLAVLDNRDQIPYVTRRGDYFVNFWRDAANKRGLWRRTTLAEYRKPKPQWEVLLDLDALAKAEGENWVWGGSECLAPDYNRCLLQLSRGGADAKVVREFDIASRSFVKDGFALPEAKASVTWLDADTVLVGTDFGPGSMTKSGYPRIIKEWKRGTPLAAARTVYEALESDVSAFAAVDHTPGFARVTFGRSTDFFNNESFLRQGDTLVRIDKPSDASFFWRREWAFLQLRSDYQTPKASYKAGSLLAIKFDAFLRGERNFDVLFTPNATRSLDSDGVTLTRDYVLLGILDNVAGRLEEVHFDNGKWINRPVNAPFPGTLSAASMDDPFVRNDPYANTYFMNYADFLTPDSLYLGQAGDDKRELLKQRPTFFNADGMRVEQLFATSKDGTRIPYFVVWPKGAKADGNNPTILYGYGGYQISMLPSYSGTYGEAWYRHGGVLVIANIRGGGEFGPTWHTSATKANKQRSYDDFAAVAEDLSARKITSPKHLGIYGGSNGGLLVGAVMVQRPALFGAVLCAVPLLDMQRYHKLLAGNSWMAEYGDPDKPEEWAWISKYSPYQNVKAGVKYPKVLFATSTRDDRVHPAHARKMAARMLEQGHDVLYYENIEGGHGGAADNSQRARLQALEFTFMLDVLGNKP